MVDMKNKYVIDFSPHDNGRVIRFRVWDAKQSKYVDRSQLRRVFGDAIGVVDVNMPDDHVIEQFTGLFDKDGNEIYENDVVEFSRWTSPRKDLVDYLCSGPKSIIYGLQCTGQYPIAGWVAISLHPADWEDGHALSSMDQRNMTLVGNIHSQTNSTDEQLSVDMQSRF